MLTLVTPTPDLDVRGSLRFAALGVVMQMLTLVTPTSDVDVRGTLRFTSLPREWV